jgi:hypothetical protein
MPVRWRLPVEVDLNFVGVGALDEFVFDAVLLLTVVDRSHLVAHVPQLPAVVILVMARGLRLLQPIPFKGPGRHTRAVAVGLVALLEAGGSIGILWPFIADLVASLRHMLVVTSTLVALPAPSNFSCTS